MDLRFEIVDFGIFQSMHIFGLWECNEMISAIIIFAWKLFGADKDTYSNPFHLT